MCYSKIMENNIRLWKWMLEHGNKWAREVAEKWLENSIGKEMERTFKDGHFSLSMCLMVFVPRLRKLSENIVAKIN